MFGPHSHTMSHLCKAMILCTPFCHIDQRRKEHRIYHRDYKSGKRYTSPITFWLRHNAILTVLPAPYYLEHQSSYHRPHFAPTTPCLQKHKISSIRIHPYYHVKALLAFSQHTVSFESSQSILCPVRQPIRTSPFPYQASCQVSNPIPVAPIACYHWIDTCSRSRIPRA